MCSNPFFVKMIFSGYILFYPWVHRYLIIYIPLVTVLKHSVKTKGKVRKPKEHSSQEDHPDA
jgi:hypothetical protein